MTTTWPENIRDVIGLDLSLTETGISTAEETCHSKTPATRIKGMKRIQSILDFVEDTMEEYQENPLIVIEGYSYGSRTGQAHSLGELGGVVRFALWESNHQYIDVPPSTLKIFATGKGNVGKTEVVVAVRERLGLETTNDNEADARWLREMGLHLTGQPTVDLPKTHMRALDKIKMVPAHG